MEICWQNNLKIFQTVCRSSHRSCSNKEAVLKNFLILTRKQLCWSLFYKKAWGLRPEKKETPIQVFSCEYCEISRTSVSKLRMAASGYILQNAFRTCSCFILFYYLYIILLFLSEFIHERIIHVQIHFISILKWNHQKNLRKCSKLTIIH